MWRVTDPSSTVDSVSPGVVADAPDVGMLRPMVVPLIDVMRVLGWMLPPVVVSVRAWPTKRPVAEDTTMELTPEAKTDVKVNPDPAATVVMMGTLGADLKMLP